MATQRSARQALAIMALAVSSAYAAAETAAMSAVAADPATCAPHVANWISFDAPGAGITLFGGTRPAGINDLGEVAGTYVDENLISHGFLRTRSGTIASFDPPNVSTAHGGGGTTVQGLNNRGDIVGGYMDQQFAQHGFIRSRDGRFTTVDDPDPSVATTYLAAINDRGIAVGGWAPDNGAQPQGLVRQADGSITNIAASGGFNNINDSGEASGGTNNFSSGLLLQRDGKLLTYAPPQANFVQPTGLNNQGTVAGTYGDPQSLSLGFLRYANGRYTTVSPSEPTYNTVSLASINNRGTALGYEAASGGPQQEGLAQLADGTQVLVSAPAADQQYTNPTAINDQNILTGDWYDGTTIHGFVATLITCH